MRSTIPVVKENVFLSKHCLVLCVILALFFRMKIPVSFLWFYMEFITKLYRFKPFLE